MTTPRGFRDRADEGLLTLIGDIPELVRNLIVAEVDAAKRWLAKTAKDAGVGAGWMAVALFFLFWSIPALIAFAIIGLASWWPAWLAALVVFGGVLVVAVLFALLGLARFRRLGKRQNPGQAIAEDLRIVKEAGDDI